MYTSKTDIVIAVVIALFVAFVIATFVDTIAFGGAIQDAVYGTI